MTLTLFFSFKDKRAFGVADFFDHISYIFQYNLWH